MKLIIPAVILLGGCASAGNDTLRFQRVEAFDCSKIIVIYETERTRDTIDVDLPIIDN